MIMMNVPKSNAILNLIVLSLPLFVDSLLPSTGRLGIASRPQHKTILNRIQRREQVGPEADDPLFSPERLNIIFDSKCSVCQFEVDYLKSRINDHFGGSQMIRFTDLEAEEGYDESNPANGGVTYEMGMRSFHAVKPDGEVLHGVPVFREAYDIVDQAWVWEVTKWPIIGSLASIGYDLFAKIRTPLTRGSSVEDLIDEHYKETLKNEEGRNTACIPCQSKDEVQ